MVWSLGPDGQASTDGSGMAQAGILAGTPPNKDNITRLAIKQKHSSAMSHSNLPQYFEMSLSPSAAGNSALRTPHSVAAFTLIELLVVIVIIGLLATIGLPAIRGMTKSNVAISANRQLLDDIGYRARSEAIGDHTTVYMVFIPAHVICNTTLFPLTGKPNVDTVITNLYTGQFTTYALVSLRSVGDQPGTIQPALPDRLAHAARRDVSSPPTNFIARYARPGE